MTEAVLKIVDQLTSHGLLGEKALSWGSPDGVMLVSGGPKSHLSIWSMISGPTKRRAIIRQPSREVLPSAPLHTPHKGELRLTSPSLPLRVELEEWKHGAWYHEVTLHASDIEDVMLRLKQYTSKNEFSYTHNATFPHQPFWVSALSYDLVQWTQPLRLQYPPQEGALLAVLWYVECGVVLENGQQTPIVFGSEPTWCDQAIHIVNQPWPELSLHTAPSFPEHVSHNDELHKAKIIAVQEAIVQGYVYQVNIGKKWHGEIDHPYLVFQRLTRTNPAPFSAYLEASDLGFAIVSSSPESLLQCNGTDVMTAPIKGTCPQGLTPEESLQYRQSMLADEKERAEHRMLVDLMRNDLTVIGQPGTIEVYRSDVEAYANVQHLVSHIRATLRPEVSASAALQAIFPGGSISGCPRTMVCAAIDELEQQPRSFWTGSIGWIDIHANTCSWNILIRTMEAHRHHSTWYGTVGAGGGITIASDADKEVEEAAWKGAALRIAAGWLPETDANIAHGQLEIYPFSTDELLPFMSTSSSIRTYDDDLAQHSQGGVLFIENLDSFSYNIAHAIAQAGHDVIVLEARKPQHQLLNNVQFFSNLFETMKPSHLILGPGPGSPDDAPITQLLAKMALQGDIPCPVLGICLGHQALAQADGWSIVPSPQGPVHGVPTQMKHTSTGLFAPVGHASVVLTRYNSLIAIPEHSQTLVANLFEEKTNLVMGTYHPALQIHTLQAHPESIGSKDGWTLLHHFLQITSDD